MSKTLKIIIAAAAMIAIPYAAPIIAGAIGVSGTVATIAIGAGLGAGVSAATGGDPLIGAITGGIGAGAGPLFGGANAAGSAGTAASTTGTAAGTAGTAAGAASNLSPAFQAALTTPLTTGAAGAAGAGTVGGLSSAFQSALTTPLASGATSLANLGASAAAPTIAGGGAASGIAGALGKIVSNPVFQNVAPKLLGGLAASGGVANTLTGIQQAELEKARIQNENVYNTKLSESMALLNQARQLDPNYFGQQAAQAAITKGGLQTAESTRGMTGERLAAERRRGRLATSRASGSAFQQGYATGLEGQLKARQAGLATLPQYPTMGTEAAAVGELSKQAQEAKRKQSEDIAALFGSVISAGKAAPTNVG